LLLLAAALLVMTAIVVGCGGTATTTTGATTATTAGAPGTTAAPATETTTAVTAAPTSDQPVLKIGIIGGSFPSLNPFAASDVPSKTAWQSMYGSLVGYEVATKEFKPEFAESWTVSPDGLTYTFKVRSGAVWSDGKPITSKDAAFTLNTMVSGLASGVTASWGPFVSTIAKAEAPDDTTLIVTLSGPSPQSLILANLSVIPLLPEQFWGPLAAGDGSALKTATMDPAKEDVVVAGPFTIEKLDIQGTTIFKRIDTFYGEKPLITGYGVQSLMNVDAAIQALKAGELDVVVNIPPSGAEPLAAAGNLETKGIGVAPCFFVINYSKDYAAHPELTNVKVRQAMNVAVDRAQICKVVFRDFGTPGGFMLPPVFVPEFMSAAAPVPAFDTAQANSILDGLGFAKGSDGIRVANGVKMDYTVLVGGGERVLGDRIFGILKQNFAEIGVNLTEEVLDNPYAAFFVGETAYKNYPMMVFPGVGIQPDPQGLLAYQTSMMLSRANFSGYSNPAYDELFKQQAVTADPAQRKALIDQMAAILQQDVVYVGLADIPNLVAWDKAWQNLEDLSGLSGWFDVRNNWAFNRLAKQQ
jgi:peptide/nickel transport system substrate-binding protein